MAAGVVRAFASTASPRPSARSPFAETIMRVLSVPEARHLYLVRLTKALRERGHDVREAPYPYLRWPRGVGRFARQVMNHPDIVHMHWHIFDSRLLARLFFRTRVPKIWTVHNIVPHRPVFRDDLAMTHRYLDRVEVAVWHSQRNIDEVRRRFAARSLPTEWNAENRIIPCMSFNGAWPDDMSDEEARHRLGLDRFRFVVGHFAPTLPYKGTRRFLEAMDQIPRTDVAFLIFGECHDRSLARDIEAAAKHRPELKAHLGPLRDEELQTWFKASDVLVQPYTDVTTSGSIGFATAFRRPVIATPVGNIPDVIEHGVTGWLAQDGPAIVDSIHRAMNDREATHAMGQRAFEAMDRMAGVREVTDAYIAAYGAAREGLRA